MFARCAGALEGDKFVEFDQWDYLLCGKEVVAYHYVGGVEASRKQDILQQHGVEHYVAVVGYEEAAVAVEILCAAAGEFGHGALHYLLAEAEHHCGLEIMDIGAVRQQAFKSLELVCLLIDGGILAHHFRYDSKERALGKLVESIVKLFSYNRMIAFFGIHTNCKDTKK